MKKLFSRFTAADGVICAGAVAAIVSTFMPWYGWESIRFSLWDLYRGMAYIILAAGALALAEISSRVAFFGEDDGLSARGALLEGVAMLVISGLVALLALIRLFSVPDIEGGLGMYVVIGRSWGLWLGLLAAVILVTGSTMKLLEKRQDRSLPLP